MDVSYCRLSAMQCKDESEKGCFEWMTGWMHGCMDGWTDGRTVKQQRLRNITLLTRGYKGKPNDQAEN